MDDSISFSAEPIMMSGWGSALAIKGKQVQIMAKPPPGRLIKEEPTDEIHWLTTLGGIRRGKREKVSLQFQGLHLSP